ncbi:MAG: GNAT family N-acetyltransferase [Candidatus Hydrogenedentes bacterium]|nr:GNAT family N-acetyltransferase [Candidatus Hydrogenedentota bacterium]
MPRIERISATSPNFEAIREIRRRVFVQEQGVSPANEFDDIDRDAVHFLACLDGAAVGTARLYAEGGVARIGRVAVLASARGRGVGSAIMEQALLEARRLGYDEVVLHAQTRVRSFYERLGFRSEGDVYEEEGIPHLSMRLIGLSRLEPMKLGKD